VYLGLLFLSRARDPRAHGPGGASGRGSRITPLTGRRPPGPRRRERGDPGNEEGIDPVHSQPHGRPASEAAPRARPRRRIRASRRGAGAGRCRPANAAATNSHGVAVCKARAKKPEPLALTSREVDRRSARRLVWRRKPSVPTGKAKAGQSPRLASTFPLPRPSPNRKVPPKCDAVCIEPAGDPDRHRQALPPSRRTARFLPPPDVTPILR